MHAMQWPCISSRAAWPCIAQGASHTSDQVWWQLGCSKAPETAHHLTGGLSQTTSLLNNRWQIRDVPPSAVDCRDLRFSRNLSSRKSLARHHGPGSRWNHHSAPDCDEGVGMTRVPRPPQCVVGVGRPRLGTWQQETPMLVLASPPRPPEQSSSSWEEWKCSAGGSG